MAAWLLLYFLRDDLLVVLGIVAHDEIVMIILLMAKNVTDKIIVAFFLGWWLFWFTGHLKILMISYLCKMKKGLDLHRLADHKLEIMGTHWLLKMLCLLHSSSATLIGLELLLKLLLKFFLNILVKKY
ncbi:hypothetical protein P3X46_007636 [Hevea brasiliensis]|uniref:Transmembrane protein n=1 Tax=Hevea brasiliensis TaxID=3981 RepID=A0ABQ9MU55_HEVBR|nr:hypothetical protein P3X46_007636 [Hevea brasiliensis]